MDDYLRSDAPVIEALDRAWDRSRLSVAHPARAAALAGLPARPVRRRRRGGVVARGRRPRPRRRRSSPRSSPSSASACPTASGSGGCSRWPSGSPSGSSSPTSSCRWPARGPWQIAAVVLVSMGAASLLDGGPVLVTQAAVQGIVVAAWRATPGQAFTRWTDALIGGGVALVAATVVPQAPLRRPRVAAAEAVRKISELLRGAEASADDRDVERAAEVLASARGTESLLRELQQRRPTRGCRSSPARRSSAGTRRTCARWSSSSSRSTARCAAPGCSCAGSPCRSGGASRCRPAYRAAHARARRRRRRHRPGPGGERVARDRSVRACSPWPRRRGRLPRTASLSTETVLAQLRSVVVDLLQVTGPRRRRRRRRAPAGAAPLLAQ